MSDTHLVCKLRSMRLADFDRILEIDGECYSNHWSRPDLELALKPWNRQATVAEFCGRVVGFAVHEILRNHIHLVEVAVHPEFRRLGVGTQLMTPVIGKLSAVRCNRVTAEACDANLGAHQFLKSLGFIATSVARGVERDTYYFKTSWLRSKVRSLGAGT